MTYVFIAILSYVVIEFVFVYIHIIVIPQLNRKYRKIFGL